ncbi:MAG: MBL fold metallo-hydrolase [Bacilli bacterium]
MRFTVLGYWGGFPEKNEASTGFLLEHDGFRLLLDCGSGVLAKLQNYCSPLDVDAVLLTHYHHDHIADIGPLHYARQILKSDCTLPIYGHSGDEANFLRLSHAPVAEGVAYDPNKSLTIGPFHITFLRTIHPVECYAVRICDGDSTITFTADSSMTDAFFTFAKESDLLIADCNLFAGMDGSANGHMTSTEVGTIARMANVKRLLLSHFPHSGDLEQLRQEAKEQFHGPVDLAYTGYTFS